MVERRLARRVGDGRARRSHAGHGGDVDDRPVRRAEGRQGRHRHGPRPEHVDLEDAPPHVDGRRLEVVVRDHGGGPRIVHQGVEAAPALEGGGHQALRGRPAR